MNEQNKKNYAMIKKALGENVVVDKEAVKELVDYFNNIIVSSISSKMYKPNTKFSGLMYSEGIKITVNIPKDDIQNIVNTELTLPLYVDIEDVLEEELANMYDRLIEVFISLKPLIKENTVSETTTIECRITIRDSEYYPDDDEDDTEFESADLFEKYRDLSYDKILADVEKSGLKGKDAEDVAKVWDYCIHGKHTDEKKEKE